MSWWLLRTCAACACCWTWCPITPAMRIPGSAPLQAAAPARSATTTCGWSRLTTPPPAAARGRQGRRPTIGAPSLAAARGAGSPTRGLGTCINTCRRSRTSTGARLTCRPSLQTSCSSGSTAELMASASTRCPRCWRMRSWRTSRPTWTGTKAWTLMTRCCTSTTRKTCSPSTAWSSTCAPRPMQEAASWCARRAWGCTSSPASTARGCTSASCPSTSIWSTGRRRGAPSS